MKQLLHASICLAILFAAATVRAASSPPKEEQLIQALASPDPQKVSDTLDRLVDYYPESTNAINAIVPLLKKPEMRRRAAVTLGKYHATLELEDVKLVFGLLRAYDSNEVMDGLKTLRALKEPDSITQVMVTNVLPLLHEKDAHILRDSCRTLAALGNKDIIPEIKPLLQDKRSDVRKDAQDAIAALSAKP